MLWKATKNCDSCHFTKQRPTSPWWYVPVDACVALPRRKFLPEIDDVFFKNPRHSFGAGDFLNIQNWVRYTPFAHRFHVNFPGCNFGGVQMHFTFGVWTREF